MMAAVLSTLLFTTVTSAQLTQTLYEPFADIRPAKIGYVGSVVALNNDLTTIRLAYDEGVATDALELGDLDVTQTFGHNTRIYPTAAADRAGLGVPSCGWESDKPEIITCTVTWDSDRERIRQCPDSKQMTRTATSTTAMVTRTHTYPARLDEASGVETWTQILTYYPNTMTRAEWCDDPSFTPEPVTSSHVYSGEAVKAVQLVITGGLEKLDSTATATISHASSTSAASSSPTADPPAQETNSAMKNMPGKALLMGVGAAAAAFGL